MLSGTCSFVVFAAIGTFAFNKVPPPAQKQKFFPLQDKAVIIAQVSAPSGGREDSADRL